MATKPTLAKSDFKDWKTHQWNVIASFTLTESLVGIVVGVIAVAVSVLVFLLVFNTEASKIHAVALYGFLGWSGAIGLVAAFVILVCFLKFFAKGAGDKA